MFRYRLAESEGLARDSSAGTQLSQLPPGPYTLEVMARNAQGVWSTEPAG